jgi:hypothetical protein
MFFMSVQSLNNWASFRPEQVAQYNGVLHLGNHVEKKNRVWHLGIVVFKCFFFVSVLELRTLKPDTRADFGVFAMTVNPWSIVKPDYNQSYLPYGEGCVVLFVCSFD